MSAERQERRTFLQTLPAFADLTSDQQKELEHVVERLPRGAYKLFHLLAQSLGQACCSKCLNTEVGSSQIAKQKQNLKNAGFDIPDATREKCPKHGKSQPHYRLKALRLRGSVNRTSYSPAELRKIRDILGNRDAFTGVTSSSNASLEVDHRVPSLRWSGDEERIDINDEEKVRSTFQLLTRTHNLLKSRACEQCVKTGKRSPFLGLKVLLQGRRGLRSGAGM